jgi:hypothetical protein
LLSDRSERRDKLVKNKLAAVIKSTGVILCLVAFFFIYGTAGASDLNLISVSELIIRLIAGIAAMVFGALLAALKQERRELH